MIAALKEPVDLALQFAHRTSRHRPSRIDYDIPRRSQTRKPFAHHFANPPLEAVAENGFSNSPGCGEADSRVKAVSRQTERRKERTALTESVIVNFAEFARS